MKEVVKTQLPSVSLLITHNADSCIEIAVKEKPSLILVDIKLPGKSGYDALRMLKNNQITCSIPVWAISAFASEADIQRGLASGFNEYITKPLKLKFLVALIQKEIKESIGGEKDNVAEVSCTNNNIIRLGQNGAI